MLGKHAKKIKKNMTSAGAAPKSGSRANGNSALDAAVKNKIEAFKESGQYEDALSFIIDCFEKGYVNQELFLETARIYYAVGDYARTIVWAKKLLTFDGSNIDGQVLLAKVYALQDEMNDCFTALERLTKDSRTLSPEVQAEIEDLLNYFADDYDEEDLAAGYPGIFAFIHGEKTAANPVPEENKAAEVGGSAPEDKSAGAAAKQETGDLPESRYIGLKNQPVDKIIGAIMQQPVSLMEKLDLCLQFAVYSYIEKDLVKTLMLLKQALLIDGNHTLTLKNAGFILGEMGEKAGALEILSKIKEKDLMVLKEMERLSRKR